MDGMEHPPELVLSGSYSNWDGADPFNVGNEGSSDRPWHGTIRMVAVYDRPLSGAEILQNFQAGPEPGMPCTLTASVPTEVALDLSLQDSEHMSWSASADACSYNVYRGVIDASPWSFNQTCFDSNLQQPGSSDSGPPPVGETFFYAVTGMNDHGEGPLGMTSTGEPRPNSTPCP